MDGMLEDPRSTILILKNYDGQDLGEFRSNLAKYGAVKVSDIDGSGGGVDSLQIEVNAENYKVILDLLKQKIIENGRGFDAKNERTTQAPNELNIKSMYSDMELDANAIELEFRASLEYLEFFFRTVKGLDPEGVRTDVKFKRNILVNEESLVNMIGSSQGIVSQETLLTHHPMVDDVSEELEKLKEEKDDALDRYYNPFGGVDYESRILEPTSKDHGRLSEKDIRRFGK